MVAVGMGTLLAARPIMREESRKAWMSSLLRSSNSSSAVFLFCLAMLSLSLADICACSRACSRAWTACLRATFGRLITLQYRVGYARLGNAGREDVYSDDGVLAENRCLGQRTIAWRQLAPILIT